MPHSSEMRTGPPEQLFPRINFQSYIRFMPETGKVEATDISLFYVHMFHCEMPYLGLCGGQAWKCLAAWRTVVEVN